MEWHIKSDNLFHALSLNSGKALKIHRNSYFFFIVEHPQPDSFIHDYALLLLMSRCRNFDFYGSYSRKWDLCFDSINLQLHSDDDAPVASTTNWNCISDFVEALEVAITTLHYEFCDIYLIYDDETIYKLVLEKIQDLLYQE